MGLPVFLFMTAFLALAVLTISLGAAAFQNAGALPNWNWTAWGVGAAAAIYSLAKRNTRGRALDRHTSFLLAAFLALAAFQVCPLPTGLVGILSPARYALLKATEPVLGPVPAWATLSAVPWLSLQSCVTLGSLALTFLLVRELTLRFREQSRIWVAAWPLLIIGALEGALGFYQAYAEGAGGFATGTYINRDHYAALLELILPFAMLYPVAILQRDPHRQESPAGPALKACGVLVFAAIILIGITHSLSRMAFLATLASTFVAGSIAVTLRNSQIAPRIKITLWRRWLPAALVAVVVALGFIFLPTDPLIGRFSELARTEDIGADTRAQIWRETTGLVKDYQLFGCGLGGYESVFMKYKTVAPMQTVDFAHNDYLQVLAEIGVFGFAAGALFLFRILYSAIRETVYATSPDERYISIACLAALTAISLHSFTDFNMYRNANALTVAWIAGIASTGLTRRRKTPTGRKGTISSSEERGPQPVSTLVLL